MKIIASSLQQAADWFLHAGYLSGAPRMLDTHNYGGMTPPRLQLDVAESLRLQGETLATTVSSDPIVTATTSASPGWPTMLLGAALLAGVVTLLYWLRHRLRGYSLPSFHLRPIHGATAMMALAALGLLQCKSKPSKAPWDGVKLQRYADPAAATKVLLHGIIADGIRNVGQAVDRLADIRNEVGLPTKKPTRGQVYALKTYGIDGWGNKFRLAEDWPTYTVTSAGADGKFDTSDDLSRKVTQSKDETWDQELSTYFVRKGSSGAAVILFHRWTGKHFIYNNRSVARALTGGDLFDLWTASDLSAEQKILARGSFKVAARGTSHQPLVMQVF